MKIVADRSIPFLEGVFEPYAEVVYEDGPSISREQIADADALIVRTRTKCDKELLEGSRLRIIATATVSTSNIDREWCDANGIFVKNASGCNAGAVSNYVFSALYGLAARKSIQLEDKTIGIIGVGACGQRVEDMAKALGLHVLRYDPIRASKEWYTDFVDLDRLLEGSDIVTMHFPLNSHTRRMADASFFDRMKPGAFFINASNGELVDEDALLDAIPKLGPVVLDSWHNEPNVNQELLGKVDIATPHISGYSLQGKQIGSSLAVRAVARFFGISELFDFFPETDIHAYKAVKLDVHGKSQGEIASIIQYNYPIFTDDFMFRMNPSPEGFQTMRANYSYRREFFI